MRKCIRCESEMIENYDIKVEGAAYGLKITQQGIFKDNLGKVKAAVWPSWIIFGWCFKNQEIILHPIYRKDKMREKPGIRWR